MRSIDRSRIGGRVDSSVDVLVSLQQQNRVREASSLFLAYMW